MRRFGGVAGLFWLSRDVLEFDDDVLVPLFDQARDDDRPGAAVAQVGERKRGHSGFLARACSEKSNVSFSVSLFLPGPAELNARLHIWLAYGRRCTLNFFLSTHPKSKRTKMPLTTISHILD